MSTKIRAISAETKNRITPGKRYKVSEVPVGRLTEAHAKIQGTVLCNNIFSSDSRIFENGSEQTYEDRYTKTGYIDLPLPVINPFTAGKSFPVWRRVLGLDENAIRRIVNNEVVYDTVNNEELKAEDVRDSKFIEMHTVTTTATRDTGYPQYVFGAEYLIYLLNHVSIDDRIKSVIFEEYVKKAVGTKLIKTYGAEFFYDCIEEIPVNEDFINNYIYNNDDPRWIFANYILNLDDTPIDENIRDAVYEDLRETAYNRFIEEPDQFPILPILFKIKEDGVDVLLKQVLTYIFIQPIGYRPCIDGRVDKISVQYNDLLKNVRELADVINFSNTTMSKVFSLQRKITKIVTNIFTGEKELINTMSFRDRNEYKSLSDSMTGKDGLIRDRMEGAREDYSGRAVITCDPYMPIDTVGVPRKILRKIAKPLILRSLKKDANTKDMYKGFKNQNLSGFAVNGTIDTSSITFGDYMEEFFKSGDRYGVIGRQPTLYYLGMQAFKIMPVDGNAIVLSPLIVMPFNADFDGDQMHVNMPTTWKSHAEVRDKMAFKNNIFYPKNGEITVVTRHEIVYGLWATLIKQNAKDGATLSDADIDRLTEEAGITDCKSLSAKVYELVCIQKINVYDYIQSCNAKAGTVAFDYAVVYGTSYSNIQSVDDNGNVTTKHVNGATDFIYEYENEPNTTKKPKLSSFITSLLLGQYKKNISGFLGAINRLVKLGFSVAKIWPPDISTIIDDSIVKHVRQEIQKFNEDIKIHEDLVNYGFELNNEYTTFFDKAYESLQKSVTKYLLDELDPNNGYLTMMLSGGKGDKSNILQIFGMKGRVQKNDFESFNSIVSGCYADQLTGLEHFITAFGSRKGMADKVLATAEPGYMSRKLEHAGAPIVITNDDCGTQDGLRICVDEITPFIDESQIAKIGSAPDIGSLITQTYDEDGDACFGIQYDNYINFYEREDVQTQLRAATHYVVPLIMGRYVVLPNKKELFIRTKSDAEFAIASSWGAYIGDKYIPPMMPNYKNRSEEYLDQCQNMFLELINDYADALNLDGYDTVYQALYKFTHLPLILRSPIYCSKPCCKKCYGIDLTKGNIKINDSLPEIGRGIGFIAAQAIGEPGTQMTMKNFQKGGVTTESNLTSSFELIEDYFELHDLSNKRKNKRNIISYDAISPVTGYVKEQHLGNGSKKIIVTKTNSEDDNKNLIGNNRNIIVHESTRLKDYVNKGDSFQLIQGNLNMKEVLRYRGYDRAVLYLVLKLYDIFQSQEVDIKHFEVIATAMTYASCYADVTTVDNKNEAIPFGKGSTFSPGSYISKNEIAYRTDGYIMGAYTLIGLKALPKYRADFFESMFMENMDSYVPRAIVMNPNDSMTNPIIRAAFGLNIGIGTDMEK